MAQQSIPVFGRNTGKDGDDEGVVVQRDQRSEQSSTAARQSMAPADNANQSKDEKGVSLTLTSPKKEKSGVGKSLRVAESSPEAQSNKSRRKSKRNKTHESPLRLQSVASASATAEHEPSGGHEADGSRGLTQEVLSLDGGNSSPQSKSSKKGKRHRKRAKRKSLEVEERKDEGAPTDDQALAAGSQPLSQQQSGPPGSSNSGSITSTKQQTKAGSPSANSATDALTPSVGERAAPSREVSGQSPVVGQDKPSPESPSPSKKQKKKKAKKAKAKEQQSTKPGLAPDDAAIPVKATPSKSTHASSTDGTTSPGQDGSGGSPAPEAPPAEAEQLDAKRGTETQAPTPPRASDRVKDNSPPGVASSHGGADPDPDPPAGKKPTTRPKNKSSRRKASTHGQDVPATPAPGECPLPASSQREHPEGVEAADGKSSANGVSAPPQPTRSLASVKPPTVPTRVRGPGLSEKTTDAGRGVPNPEKAGTERDGVVAGRKRGLEEEEGQEEAGPGRGVKKASPGARLPRKYQDQRRGLPVFAHRAAIVEAVKAHQVGGARDPS